MHRSISFMCLCLCLHTGDFVHYISLRLTHVSCKASHFNVEILIDKWFLVQTSTSYRFAFISFLVRFFLLLTFDSIQCGSVIASSYLRTHVALIDFTHTCMWISQMYDVHCNLCGETSHTPAFRGWYIAVDTLTLAKYIPVKSFAKIARSYI